LFTHEAAPDNFNVVRNFPYRVVPCQSEDYEGSDSIPTLEAVGLDHAELLYVQDNDA
jgi:FAS-associated factor 2